MCIVPRRLTGSRALVPVSSAQGARMWRRVACDHGRPTIGPWRYSCTDRLTSGSGRPAAREARHGDGGEMIATALVTVDGSEGDLERAVVHEADRYGLWSSVSTTRRARPILVETVPRREGEVRPSPT